MAENDTYPLIPDRITNREPTFKTIKVNFESGNEQRHAKWSKPKTKFSLVHQHLSTDELKVLMDFFKSKKGGFRKFYFIDHILGETHTVKFANDSLRIQHVNAVIHNVNVELIEC